MAEFCTSSSNEAVAAMTPPKTGVTGVDLITAPTGDVVGIAVSPATQLYTTLERFVGMSRLMALPIADRYALAGKVAAVPEEHPRIVERLASQVATSLSENGALNALYILETCKELVPGFQNVVPAGRLEKAAELSPHSKVQAAVLLGEKPPEWEAALKQNAPMTVMIVPQVTSDDDELPDKGIVYDAGRAVGDVTKFVGSAAMGGVGLVSDTLGITDGAEDDMADGAVEAVNLVGDGANLFVDSIDQGLGGTAADFEEKGVAGTVEDGMKDSLDLMKGFATDAVLGIADGVRSALDWVANDDEESPTSPQTHKVVIVVSELFGEERSLGLRLENRVITKFTKPEAERLGWRLGDCIIGVGTRLVTSHDDMLVAIGTGKEAMKNSGTALRFLVERVGGLPVRH